MTNKQTLELALNALKCLFGLPDKFTGEGGDVAVWRLGGSYRAQEAIKALEEALAKQEQGEPLEYWNAVEGWVKLDEVREHFDSVKCATIYKNGGEGRVPLYTTPQQRTWVGLTDEEINKLRYKKDWTAPWTDTTFARAIEAKLKEKNT